MFVPQPRIWTQQPQHAVSLAPEYFKDSALCFLLNSKDAINLAQSNPGKVLPSVAPSLKAAQHGLGVGCANTAQSFLGTDWKAPIKTSVANGSGAFALVMAACLKSNATRAFLFGARHLVTPVNSVTVLANGYYEAGGATSINESGTLWIGVYDTYNGNASGIRIPGLLTADLKEFTVAYTRREGGSAALFINGTLAGINSTPSVQRIFNSGLNSSLSIGGAAYTTGLASADPISLIYASNRGFSDQTGIDVTRNPWQIFKAPDARIWVPVSASGGTNYSLTATSISASPPTLSSPLLAQNHVISGASIIAAAPTLSAPVVAQNHALTAIGITTAAPTLGAPVLSTAASNYALVGSGISTSPAVLSAPAISQNHELVASSIVTGAPTLSSPTLSGDAYNLTATGISTAAPTLGAPALSQNHALVGGAIAAGSPTFGTPTLVQQHVLMAQGITAGNPTLGAPELSDGSIVVYARAPDGSGYRRDMADVSRPSAGNTTRPKQRNTVRP